MPQVGLTGRAPRVRILNHRSFGWLYNNLIELPIRTIADRGTPWALTIHLLKDSPPCDSLTQVVAVIPRQELLNLVLQMLLRGVIFAENVPGLDKFGVLNC
jgi:hypothetical protein